MIFDVAPVFEMMQELLYFFVKPQHLAFESVDMASCPAGRGHVRVCTETVCVCDRLRVAFGQIIKRTKNQTLHAGQVANRLSHAVNCNTSIGIPDIFAPG